jgi:hypothetical protein
MNSMKDRVREATRARADEITPASIPPLRLSPPPPGRRWLRGDLRAALDRARRAARRWGSRAVPLASGAAVLAVLAGMGIVASLGKPTGPAIGAVLPTHVPAAGSLASPPPVPVNEPVPAYYLALTGTRKPYASNPDAAGVFSSATGAQVAKVVPPPPYRNFIGVSAAADDRTFALAAQTSTTEEGARLVTFFIVRYRPGHPARLTPVTAVRVPNGATFTAFALSPDGKKLAVASAPNSRASGISGEIQVATLATGAVATWSSPNGTVGGDTADPWSLSWTADGSTLAFNWFGGDQFASRVTPAMAAATGLRLLDVRAPAGDLAAASRLALHWENGSRVISSGGYLSDIAQITPDGRTIVAALGGPNPRHPQQVVGHLAGFAAYSAATGTLRYLLDWKATRGGQAGGPTDVLWSNASGSLLIVYAPPGHWNRIGVLRGNQLTLLPQSATVQFPAAAW